MNLDALLEPIPQRHTRPCKLGQALIELDEPYKTALQNLVTTEHENGGLTAAKLAQRLADAGLNISATVVHMHRKGQCSCRKALVG